MSTEANALSSYIFTVPRLVLYPLSCSGIGWAQSHVGSTQYRLQEQGGGGLGRASLGLILHTRGYFTSLLSSTHTAIRAILNKVASSQPGRQRREEGTKAWQEVSTRSSTWEMSPESRAFLQSYSSPVCLSGRLLLRSTCVQVKHTSPPEAGCNTPEKPDYKKWLGVWQHSHTFKN